MIPPFSTLELELSALQSKGDYLRAKIEAMKMQKARYADVSKFESMHRDCLKYIAKMWAYRSKRNSE